VSTVLYGIRTEQMQARGIPGCGGVLAPGRIPALTAPATVATIPGMITTPHLARLGVLLLLTLGVGCGRRGQSLPPDTSRVTVWACPAGRDCLEIGTVMPGPVAHVRWECDRLAQSWAERNGVRGGTWYACARTPSSVCAVRLDGLR
jgi:hypothetical protein